MAVKSLKKKIAPLVDVCSSPYNSWYHYGPGILDDFQATSSKDFLDPNEPCLVLLISEAHLEDSPVNQVEMRKTFNKYIYSYGTVDMTYKATNNSRPTIHQTPAYFR